MLDTADMYGPHINERLVGAAVAGRREQGVEHAALREEITALRERVEELERDRRKR